MTESSPTPNVLSDTERAEVLKGKLVSLLRREGYGALCSHDEGASENHDAEWGWAFFLTYTLTLWITFGQHVDLSFWGWVGTLVGAIVVVAVVLAIVGQLGAWAAGLVVAAWPVSLIVLLLSGSDIRDLAIGFGLPLVIGNARVIATRLLRLGTLRDVATSVGIVARNVPLLAPVALVVLFIPLFTADLWAAAARLDVVNGLWLAIVTVGLIGALLRSSLRRTVSPVVATRAAALQRLDDPLSSMVAEARQVAGDEESHAVDQLGHGTVDTAFASPRPTEYAPYIAKTLGGAFSRRIDQRLGPLVVGAAALLSLYFYVLAALAVDRDLVGKWVGEGVETTDLNFIVHLTLPCGPYPRVAALLGVAATAVYLAFVLTEERYSAAIADALIHGPVERCLLLAVPYVYLDEQEILRERPGSHTDDSEDEDST